MKDDAAQPKGNDKKKVNGRVTMRDIARRAGCSQPTVSFVLNNNETAKISEQTRARVLDAARELGYKAVSLPSKTQGKNPGYIDGPIAFVIDTLATSPEGVHAYDGVLEAVKATGNVVLLAETRNDPVLEPKTLQYFIDQRVSAIIYACVFTRQVELPEVLRETDIPVFLLNCYSDDMSRPAVVPGEVAGGHTATNALINAGHTDIGVITGEPFMECASGRLTGYRNALVSADLPFREELVIEGNWLPSSGFEGTKKLMALPKPPTAIFCQNDRMAVGCFEALKEMGLSIPEDVSVIGYDDDEIARHLSPPLTSMNLADRSMGRWVIDQLFHGALGNNRHPLTKLECELIERDSIAAPKRSAAPAGG
ncbi:LacI family DNA-binding transcriptional regulator [uncultured Litoreibacter sp.]|uniref:LacI family DNA-binding transcriptional regulator n=1 Tax=uncultured Litoreibacter sp. TaxID=1392394 RepID=UPI002621C3E5|nr:LacI family DNA-binding transcriptional regulator [uncultured Litoreibacter sp.]